jgi:fatty acid desaturase
MASTDLSKPNTSSLGERLRYWIFSGGIPSDTLPHDGPSYMEAIAAEGRERDDEYFGQIPDAIPNATIRELSAVSPLRSVLHIVLGWAYIIVAIWLCNRFWSPWTYLLTVLFLGARIHGMMMIMHDGSHYRLFHNKKLNDSVAELFLSWPFFISLQRYRAFHFLHHHHLGEDKDGNRVLYLTHTNDGAITADWVFPKTTAQFLFFLLKRFLAGPALALYITWINVSEAIFVWTGNPTKAWLIGRYRKPPSKLYVTLHLVFMASAIAILSYWHLWLGFFLFWVVPWSWHVVLEQIRVTSEHFAIDNPHPFYRQTRSIEASWLEKLFYLPNNGTYHLEHHMYPSVPFYRLPQLHALLMEQPGFRNGAQLTSHLNGLMRELHLKKSANKRVATG